MAAYRRTEQDPASNRGAALTFGIIADVQYADRDVRHDRYYRRAPDRLDAAIDDLNRTDVDFVIDLGDVIDGDFRSFAPIMDVYANLRVPVYRVLGNHDYGVDAPRLAEVPARLGLERCHYDFVRAGRRFVVLDGNEVSTYAHPPGSPAHAAAERILDRMRRENCPNAEAWNGGVAQNQLHWLRRTLASASDGRQDVIVLSHFPLWPSDDAHRLWNAGDVLDVLDGCPTVRAVLAAHNHAGDYTVRADVHHVTFRGMVETADETAYAVVTAEGTRLRIRGTGRERSRVMEWQ